MVSETAFVVAGVYGLLAVACLIAYWRVRPPGGAA